MALEVKARLRLPEKLIPSSDDVLIVVTDVATTPKLNKIKISNLIGSGGVPSTPPEGHYKVVNIFVNSETGKLVIEYEV